MPCVLEINSNGGSKRGHVESYLSITTNIISTATVLMVTKLGRLVTYVKPLQIIKSNNALIT